MLRYLKYLSGYDLFQKISHLGISEQKGRAFADGKGNLVLVDTKPSLFQPLFFILDQEEINYLFENGLFLISLDSSHDIERLLLLAREPDVISYLSKMRQVLENVIDVGSHILARGRTIQLRGREPLIMGVLNVTPDSFYDGGKFNNRGSSVERALEMVEEGADIVDVGGESTRPGSFPISAEEEMKRVIPVIEELSAGGETIISVDTYKSEVAGEALRAGAHIVNDVSGLRLSGDMSEVVAKYRAALVIMHIKGTPNTMQKSPYYSSLTDEILEEMELGINLAKEGGVKKESIILDPGFGFGKRFEDNLYLLNNLIELKTMGYPLLVGTSRKAFIGNIIGKPPDEREFGTAATVSLAVYNGANIIRVHDVKDMRDVVQVSWETRKARAC